MYNFKYIMYRRKKKQTWCLLLSISTPETKYMWLLHRQAFRDSLLIRLSSGLWEMLYLPKNILKGELAPPGGANYLDAASTMVPTQTPHQD